MTRENDQAALNDLRNSKVRLGEAVIELVYAFENAELSLKDMRHNIRVHLNGLCDCEPKRPDCYKQAHVLDDKQ